MAYGDDEADNKQDERRVKAAELVMSELGEGLLRAEAIMGLMTDFPLKQQTRDFIDAICEACDVHKKDAKVRVDVCIVR